MRDRILLRLLDGEPVWYPPGTESVPQPLGQPEGDARLRALLDGRRMRLLFAVPGAAVCLQSLRPTRAEARHLRRSLPYLIEEQLAGDIENLHIAAQAQGDGEYAVAVVSYAEMDRWQQQLGEFAALADWVPMPLLLPLREGTWSIVLEQGFAVARTGRCTGFVVESMLLGAMLEAALRDAGQVPDVLMHGAVESADLALLPTALRSRCTWRRGSLQTALWLGAERLPLDLRQGQYAAQLPLARWWQQMRWVAVVAALALTLQFLLAWLDLRDARSEQAALRGAIVDSYRQAVPDGALVDAERQLQRQLEQLGAVGQGSAFVPLLAGLATALETQTGTRLANLNYSNRAGEMRINVVAAGFAEVEQLRASLQAGGLGAELETSNAAGDEVRARLRLRGLP